MDQRKRILYWTPRFWPDIGGIEVLAMNALPMLQKRNYEFAVITDHGDQKLPDEMLYEGTPVHRFHFRRALKKDLKQVLKIRHQITELRNSFQPDLVHLHHPGYIAYFHLQTQAASPCPTLLTIHTDFPTARGGTDTLLGQAVRSASWVTAVSKATLTDACAIVPEICDRSSLIYNGLGTPTISPAPLPFDSPHILCLGRLVPEKGFDLALRAFAALRRQFPEARFTIAGDGELRNDLEKQAAQLGLNGRITFTGWVSPDKIPALINTSTVVVVPSRYREPFALVALQAAQMARPVVATNIGGLCESVSDQQTGLLFENENVTALTEAIAYLLKHADVAVEMGGKARLRALEIFGLDAHVGAYDALYTKLIENKGSRAI